MEEEGCNLYKVLLVDDDKSTLCGLRQFKEWQSSGFCIEAEAYDGVGALKKLSEKEFDLVITDIRMPGMDGLKFLNKLKETKLELCLMIMSTYSDFEYAQQGIRIGIFDYLMKPIDDTVLSNALKRVKLYLDEKKYLKTKRKQEKKILFENNLRFLYPTNQERNLLGLLMSGECRVTDEANKTCIELFNLTNQDMDKTEILLEKVLLQLKHELNKNFPWLWTLEEIIFHDTLSHSESVEDLQIKFSKNISRMLDVIKKYELYRSDGVVGTTCKYVVEHVEENIKLEYIANEVHISKDYIGKLFKQKTGSNFIDYVTKVKMEHAKYLLGAGEYKNYEVSAKLGYSSSDYFCRLFKEYTGVTPVQFKKWNFENFH